jgi:DNA-directed RNA polymerase specialized sigma24 family protein
MMGESGDVIRVRLRKKKKLKLPVQRKIGKAYEPEETQRMGDVSRNSRSPHIRLALTLALNAGMRDAEIKSLTWGQLHLDKGYLQVGKSKTAAGEGRTIPINSVLHQAILDHRAQYERKFKTIEDESDFADCSVMASPSPLDRCWVLKGLPAAMPLMPAMRAAVELHWPDVQRTAGSVLGDAGLAAEIMEEAIERAVAYLTDHLPENHEGVDSVLSRFWREEIGRRRKQHANLVFIDFSATAEPASSDTPFSSADAPLDAEKILRDAPPRVRKAIMMRYGGSNSWNEVAAMTATTPAAIRMSCQRFIDRIR